MRIVRSLPIAFALLALALPAAAPASSEDVIKDCADDGVIDGRYSDRELREAEHDLPSDLDEYTDCREAIRSELGGGATRRDDGAGPGSGPIDPSRVSPGGAVASSPEDVQALERLKRSTGDDGDPPAIDVGGKQVTPGDAAGGKLLGVANSSNELPASLLSALVLLSLMAAASAVLLLRRRGLPPALAARLGKIGEWKPIQRIRRVPIPRFPRR